MTLELLAPVEMSQADAAAIALGHPVADLMEAAGSAVADAIRRRFPPCRVLVLCGPGNNGGDGYVAARRLAQIGWPVAVAITAPPRGDATAAAAGWRGPIVPFAPGEAARVDLVIDAIFGAGLQRDLAPDISDVLAAARRIAAVDVPSGLDGATGAMRGVVTPVALTVTFFRKKPGHLLLPGRTLCGEVILADISLPDAVLQTVQPRCWQNDPALWRLPRPDVTAHKYTRGHVTIVGGGAMTGAARLPAAPARRAGAGMLTIACQPEAADIYRTGEPGLLVDSTDVTSLLSDARRKVWVCGPGLGNAVAQANLPLLLASGRQIVVDADAITACAGKPDALRGATVLTPHAGEFARVFGPLGADRVAAVRAAASITGAVVLLKGADTIIAAPDGRVAINANAPPWLATAGAGDVLAGIIAGLLAQGMPAWDAACAAAWLHGAAATTIGPGLIAEDLPAAIAACLRDMSPPWSGASKS
ncbi:MAG: NAD(P)H-hydrate dehydratase [Acetobacteraceae bacterium]|nr:NAD(P)H-hydrate dehydratase [Acetobacteraceae bacterium]